MAGTMLTLSPEGAQACREFADAMVSAVENIVTSTEKLVGVYSSVSEYLGVHEEAFHDMLNSIEKAQKDAADAIEKLPKMLRDTADKIDTYVGTKPSAK